MDSRFRALSFVLAMCMNIGTSYQCAITRSLVCSGPCACTPTTSANSGSITDGPGSYANNMNCFYTFTSNAVVQLAFTFFNTEGAFDFVNIDICTTSSCTSSSRVLRVSGKPSLSTVYSTNPSQPVLRLQFTSDSSVVLEGWSANWAISGNPFTCNNVRNCVSGQYVSSNTCVNCPIYSNSPAGSTAVAACVCNAGFTAPSGGPCLRQCAAGSYNENVFTSGWFGQYYTYAPEMENSNYLGFGALTPVGTSNTANINFPRLGTWPYEARQWGARWRGIITIDIAGQFTFSLNSNDGSWLWVNEVMIVDYGGRHGMWGPVSRSVTLSAGTHNVRVHFFEAGGGAGIVVMYSGPGLSGSVLIPAYYSASTCESCPTNSISPVLSSSITACVCNAGWNGPDGGTCTQCLGGTYKAGTGNSGCLGCPTNSLSPAGSTTVTACICNAGSRGPAGGPCQCNAGYTGANGGTCSQCLVNHYKAGLGPAACTPCQAHSVSVAGSIANTDCQCDAGYTGADGGPCEVCAAGTYKDSVGAAACSDCPSDSSSLAGACALQHCLCNAGFSSSGNGACAQCPSDSFRGPA